MIRQFAQNIHQYQTKIYVILLILIKKRILISSNNPINQFYPHRQKTMFIKLNTYTLYINFNKHKREYVIIPIGGLLKTKQKPICI